MKGHQCGRQGHGDIARGKGIGKGNGAGGMTEAKASSA